jgi:hypothetical protein
MLYSIVETTLYCWLILALSMLVVIEWLVSMECFLGWVVMFSHLDVLLYICFIPSLSINSLLHITDTWSIQKRRQWWWICLVNRSYCYLSMILLGPRGATTSIIRHSTGTAAPTTLPRVDSLLETCWYDHVIKPKPTSSDFSSLPASFLNYLAFYSVILVL